MDRIRDWLEQGYAKYHRTEWIGTDPIMYLHRYHVPVDQEIAGLIAASLAYGNVTAINASIAKVLAAMQPSPRQFLEATGEAEIRRAFRGFRHRWTDGAALAALLTGMQRVIREHGSLGMAFAAGDEGEDNIMIPLARWVRRLKQGQQPESRGLLSDPERGSACKRLHLYMRWMVRKDVIDPGCWSGVEAGRLLIPLDTHVYRFARACGFTRRNAADGKTAAEITGKFRMICPGDPVKYDFSLTRPGIVDGWQPEQGMKWPYINANK